MVTLTRLNPTNLRNYTYTPYSGWAWSKTWNKTYGLEKNGTQTACTYNIGEKTTPIFV